MNLFSFRIALLVGREMRCVCADWLMQNLHMLRHIHFVWLEFHASIKEMKTNFYDYIRFDLDSFGNELRHLIHIEQGAKNGHFRSLLCCQHSDTAGTGRNIHRIYMLFRIHRSICVCVFFFCFA